MFEIVFDYGEHTGNAPKPIDVDPWSARADPFSSYRAGFEVRTYRVCRRVLMFHHFPDEAGVERNCLVRSITVRPSLAKKGGDLLLSAEHDPVVVRVGGVDGVEVGVRVGRHIHPTPTELWEVPIKAPLPNDLFYLPRPR